MKICRQLLLFIAIGYATQLRPESDLPEVKLQVLRPVAVNYYLLTKNSPAEFAVTGIPDTGIWVRIYSRLWFNREVTPGFKGWYYLKVVSSDTVRRFRFETTVSSTTRGPAGQKVGKWRSCYLHLTPNVPRFRLLLDSASTDTVAISFRFQSPRVWERLRLPNLSYLTLILPTDTGEARFLYHRLKTATPLRFTVAGPCRLRLRCRIDYDPVMTGFQNFLVEVRTKDKLLLERNFRVRPDLQARYQEVADVIPSIERTTVLQLGEGEYALEVVIKGTPAKTAALTIERLSGEKYE